MNGHTVGFPMKYPSFTRQKKTAGLKVEKNDETVTLNCSPEEQRRKVNIQLLNLKMKAPNYQTAVRGNREETSANLNNFSSCNAWWSETSQKKTQKWGFCVISFVKTNFRAKKTLLKGTGRGGGFKILNYGNS